MNIPITYEALFVLETAQYVLAKLGNPSLCLWRHLDVRPGPIVPKNRAIQLRINLESQEYVWFEAGCNLDLAASRHICEYLIHLPDESKWRGLVVRSDVDHSIVEEIEPRRLSA